MCLADKGYYSTPADTDQQQDTAIDGHQSVRTRQGQWKNPRRHLWQLTIDRWLHEELQWTIGENALKLSQSSCTCVSRALAIPRERAERILVQWWHSRVLLSPDQAQLTSDGQPIPSLPAALPKIDYDRLLIKSNRLLRLRCWILLQWIRPSTAARGPVHRSIWLHSKNYLWENGNLRVMRVEPGLSEWLLRHGYALHKVQ